MIIYGAMLCPDCVQCRKDLDEMGVDYEFRSITENLIYLKEFLKLRDEQKVFASVKAEGKIGIPCVIGDDGKVTLNWK